MKPTRIVNIENIDHIPGFKDLPSVVETEEAHYRILCGEPTGSIHESALSTGVDLSIEVNNNDNTRSVWNPVLKHLAIARHTKSLQAVYLEYFMRSLVGSEAFPLSYHHLKTYSGGLHFGLPRTVPEGKYVIKPSTGARSNAIITLDTTKMHLREFSNLLDQHCKKYNEQTESSKSEWVEKFFKQHGIDYCKGLEYHEDESANYVFSRNLVVQEYNPFKDVHCIELRALRCVGTEPLIYNRQDLDPSFVGYSTKFNPTTIRPELHEQIQAVLRHPDFPLTFGSVDIWVNNFSGTWGIYEFQPEYCSINIRDGDHIQFMENVLDGLWNYCYGQ